MKTAIFAFFLLSATLYAAAAQPEILHLQDAIQIALKNNRSLQSSKLESDQSFDQLAAVRTHYYPVLNVNLLASRLLNPFSLSFDEGAFGTYPGIGPIPSENTKIETEPAWTSLLVGTVQQPLSQIYRIKLNEELLRAVQKESWEKERQAIHDVVNQVKKLYFAILQSQSSLQYSEEELKLYRELKRVTDDYVIQNAALKSDAMDVSARLAKAEYDSLVTKNQMDQQMEQLNILLGRDIRTKFTVDPVGEPAAFENDIEKAQEAALQQRPELLQAQYKVQEADLDARIKKSEYIPDISFSFNYFSPIGIDFVPDRFLSVGFYMTWDVFDWGRKGHEFAEKKKVAEQARLSLKETEQRVLADVNEQHRKVSESVMLVNVLRLAEESSEEKVRVMLNRYKEQSALLKDVLQEQTALQEAHHQVHQAILGMWAARADFEKATGVDQ
jgi:outer membrane protein TolC